MQDTSSIIMLRESMLELIKALAAATKVLDKHNLLEECVDHRQMESLEPGFMHRALEILESTKKSLENIIEPSKN